MRDGSMQCLPILKIKYVFKLLMFFSLETAKQLMYIRSMTVNARRADTAVGVAFLFRKGEYAMDEDYLKRAELIRRRLNERARKNREDSAGNGSGEEEDEKKVHKPGDRKSVV